MAPKVVASSAKGLIKRKPVQKRGSETGYDSTTSHDLTPGGTVSIDDDGDDDGCLAVQKRRRKRKTGSGELVELLKGIHQKQMEKQDKYAKQTKEMHDDKMQMFGKYLEIMQKKEQNKKD